MARGGRQDGTRLIGAVRRDRAGLLVTTALTAAVLAVVALPAHAQLAPDTQPAGGVVVAGSARIGATATTTTVTQGSARAAVNWQSFNLGSKATVNFVQPSAQSVTLNRVLAPDPSVIAGHIHANGGIVITNRAGVVFTHGAEVNAASVLVSAAGITNRNFMAGRMQFDIPARPGARIVNAGRITVKAAGLAALVAPEVANSGVITAKLGHVVLAGGASAATLDLYGDGLVSLDVTPEAHSVRLANGAKATALVTNTGTIIASGGTVQLTAREADGLVQDLVDAGGTIAADSVGRHAGTIAITGIGGSIRIPGTLLAAGKAPGTTGGAIALDATGTVALAGAARLDASGAAGGGTVAIGTTLARARGGPATASTLTANAVSIAPHATVAADALDHGDGGHVTVLSLGSTAMSGTISARGGRLGGNGGSVEISGANLSLVGGVDTSAPLGAMGSILLDPKDLLISAVSPNDDSDLDKTPSPGQPNLAYGTPDQITDLTITPTGIQGLKGDVTLQATNNLEVASGFSLNANQSLTLQAGNDLTIDPKVVVQAGGNIELDAAFSGISGHTNTGSIVVQGTVQAGGDLTLTAGTGGIIIGTVTGFTPGSISGNAVSFTTHGAVNDATGSISATTLSGSSAGASLTGSNSVGTLGSFNAGTSTFNLTDGSGLTVNGSVQATGNLTITAGPSLVIAGGASLTAPGGSIDLSAGANGIIIDGGVGGSPPSSVSLSTTGPVNDASGSITATTLSGSSAGASLTGNNNIGTLATYDSSAGGTFNLADQSPLTVTGKVSVPSGGFLAIEADTLTISAHTGTLSAPAGTVQLAPFTAGKPVALVESGSVGAGTLAITKADLDAVSANMLQIGQTDASGNPIDGPIVIGNPGDTVTTPNVTTLRLESAGAVTEPGTLNVGTLEGAAASATLGSTSNTIRNSINVLGGFTTSAGGFSLTEAPRQLLLVSGPVSVPNGNTIALTADGISVGNGASLDAGSAGAVTLAAKTPGQAIGLTTSDGVANFGAISLGPTKGIAAITAGTLTVGTTEGGQITVVGSIGLPNVSLLDLVSGSVLSEPAATDLLTVGTLAATAESAALIGNNAIGTLGNFTVTNGALSLTDQQALAITGAVSAIGNAVTFTINNGGSVTEQAGGSITAGTLTGSAASASLINANQIGTLAAFTASSGGFSVTEGENQPLLVSGLVSVPGNQTLALSADGIAIGPTGSLSAAGATVTLAPATPGQALDVTTGLPAAPAGTYSLGDTATPHAAAVNAGTLIIGADNGGAITVSGSIVLPATTELDLLSSGAVSETTIDSLSVGTLAADVASASLIGNNAIGTLGDVTANDGFSLADDQPLTITGAVSAIGNTVSLAVNGNLGETAAGTITARTLTGTLTGSTASATFTNPNEIGTLGAFAAPGGFSLTDQQALTITGALNAGADPVTFNIKGGNLIESSAGAITSGVLSGSASSVSLDNANGVGTLGAFSSGGDFSLAEARGQTLLVTGAVSVPPGQTIALTTDGLEILNFLNLPPYAGSLNAPGGTVTLAPSSPNLPIALLGGFAIGGPGTLSIDDADLSHISASTLEIGSVTAGPILVGNSGDDITAPNEVTSLVLESADAITENGSLIAPVATLSGFAASVSLPALGNSLGALGSFTANGGFALTNSGNLLLTGPLDVGPPTGAATADLASVSGGIQEPAGLPAGSITAGTLAASAAGPIVLPSNANDIGTLGAITAPGGFTLDNPASFFIAGNLDAVGATVSLTSNGSAVETRGAITAGILSGTLASATLGGANEITDIAGLTAHGGFSLTNDQPLAISGAADFGISAASLAINGGLSEIGTGILTAGLIQGSAASVSLPNSANAIGTLGAFSAPGGLTLAVANTLAIAGLVDARAGAIDLMAGGSIAEIPRGTEITGGTLAGDELLGFAGGGALAGAAGTASFANLNTLASLGDFTALGGFTLADSGGLALLGALDAGSANVVLTGGATVTQPSGGITATTLSGTLASAALGGANHIGDLANFSAAGGFSLTDLEPLTLTGPVTAGSAAAAVTLSGSLVQTTAGTLTAGTLAGRATLIDLANPLNAITSLGAITAPDGLTLATVTDLSIAGTVNASAAPIVLNSAGAIDEIPGGTVIAGALAGSASAASFANTNSIAELGSFVAPGGFTLANAGDLPVAGPLDAGASTALLISGGSLFETDTTLFDTASQGAITAGTLTGSAGTVALTAAQNRIANLGSFSAGSFNLVDGENLGVIGTVTGNPIGLDVIGDLALGAAGSGVLSSTGPVFLTASGAITEPNGAIDAGILTGSAASASLPGANLLPLLGPFTTAGSFLLNAAVPTLTVNGPLSATSASLAAAGSLVLAGLVSADAATLSAGGPISETGGAISAGTLAGNAAAARLTGANTIGTLGAFATPGTFLLADTAPLAVAGPVTASFFGITDPSDVSFTGATDVGTLSITAGGSITEPSGTLTAALLEGSANGLVQLGPDAPAGSASIATLGPFSVGPGTFSLTDSVPLDITGPLAAGDFAIAAPGSIALANTTITTLGLPPAQQSATLPTRPGSYFDITSPTGEFFGLGRTTINPTGGPATVRIQLNQAGGLISFADLVAPTTTLILNTGAGTAIGTIDIGALIVLGNLGSATLSGTVANLSGVVASSKATISPFQSPSYRLNSCPLMSINCIFIAPLNVPEGNPLSGLAIVSAAPNRQQTDLLLPNVAARDY